MRRRVFTSSLSLSRFFPTMSVLYSFSGKSNVTAIATRMALNLAKFEMQQKRLWDEKSGNIK